MKRFIRLLDHRFTLVALILAWVGAWGAWLPHETAALTQNAYTLAEWSPFLTDVRYGTLMLAPDMLRLAVALLGMALAVAASQVNRLWLRWGLRALALLPGLILLPPYPAVLQLWRAEGYTTRFMVAMILWVGVPLSGLLDHLPVVYKRSMILLLSLGAGGVGIWAFVILRPPFEAHYAADIVPGWGLVAFVMGLIVTLTIQIALQLGRTHQLTNTL